MNTLPALRSDPPAIAAAGSGWQIQFKHFGSWYPIGECMPFAQAWDAMSTMCRHDGAQAVERRVVIAFD